MNNTQGLLFDLPKPTEELTRKDILKAEWADIQAEKIYPHNPDKPISDENPYYKKINDLATIYNTLRFLNHRNKVAIDIETTGLDPNDSDIICIQFSHETYHSVLIEWKYIEHPKILPIFKHFIYSKNVLKILHNMSFDIPFICKKMYPDYTDTQLRLEEENIFDTCRDTMILSYLILGRHTPSKAMTSADKKLVSLKLKDIVSTELGIDTPDFKSLGIHDINRPGFIVYSCKDTDITLRLYEYLMDRWDDELSDICELEHKAVIGALELNRNGVEVNTELFRGYISMIYETRDELLKELRKWIPDDVDISSSAQLSKFFYTDPNGLKIPYNSTMLTSSNQVSTSAKVLSVIQSLHPVIPIYLKYTKFDKLANSFTENIYEKIDVATNVLQGKFLPYSTRTGRYSASDPNLQQIPQPFKEFKAGLPFEELDEAFNSINLRAIFRPPKGMLMFKIDYSGQEITILAELTKDPVLTRLLLENHDIHSAFAIKAFKLKDPDTGHSLDPFNKDHQKIVKKKLNKMRKKAKGVVFGICYGITKYSLVFVILDDELSLQYSKITDDYERTQFLEPHINEAQSLIDTFYEMFPGVGPWQRKQKNMVKFKGYCKTLVGRRRYISAYNSYGWSKQAVNTPIQGTGGDIIKWVLYKVASELRHAGYSIDDAHISMTIHDEIVLVFREELEDELKKFVVDIMEYHIKDFVNFDLPLKADLDVCVSWGWTRDAFDEYLKGLKERNRIDDYNWVKSFDPRINSKE